MAQVNLQGRIKLTNPTPLGFHLSICVAVFDSRPSCRSRPALPSPILPAQSGYELGIKAFLLSRGDSVLTLKSTALGHDLAQLLARARNRDFDAIVGQTAKEIAAVDTVNRYYQIRCSNIFNRQRTFDYILIPIAGNIA